MPGKKIYNESKRRFTMTLTETAIQWLQQKQQELGANSLSDVIERLARQKLPKDE
jgi:predicted CopG family antitoxin